ncbi:MAG: CopD family protein [Pseudomonadota bacterium]|nr:CopD family protein [Pseudomonadota bacterium]
MNWAVALHVIAAVIWIGGMFFAYMALRPSVPKVLDPPAALRLWLETLTRFMRWVWIAVILLPLSGYWIIFIQWGGMEYVDNAIHIMQGMGLVMILLFMRLYFGPLRGLRNSVEKEDFAAAGQYLAQIRMGVEINLILGVILVIIVAGLRG